MKNSASRQSSDIQPDQALTENNLPETHERFKSVVDHVLDSIISIDQHGIIMSANPASERLFGYKADELIGKNVKILMPSPFCDEHDSYIANYLNTGKAKIIGIGREVVGRRKDGSIFPMELGVSQFQINGNQFFTGIVRDISDRKEKQEALREANDRLRSVVNHVVDGIITIDDKGIVQSFNPAAERIFQCPAEQVLGRNVKCLMPEPFHSGHDTYIQNYLKSGDAKIIGIGREVTGRRVDGTTFPLDLAVSEFEVGERRYFTGIIRDITEHKRTEETKQFLADATALLATLTDYNSTLQKVSELAVPLFADWCVVELLDNDNRIQLAAFAHREIARESLIRQVEKNISETDLKDSVMKQVLRDGNSVLITDMTDPSDYLVTVDEENSELIRTLNPQSIMFVPLKARKRTIGVMKFVYSDSARRYDQSDLSIAEDLAHRMAIAIENAQLNEAIRDGDQRKDEFLAMLAHELRNPLAPIMNALEILNLSGNGSPLEAKARETMRRQIDHMVRLVDDLLDLSRIMRGKIELRKEKVLLSSVIDRAVETTQPAIDAHGHEFHIHRPRQPVWVDADPVRLSQVVANLLSNAAKYTPEGGKIQLFCRQVQSEVTIEIEDNGVGIEPDYLPYLFDLFQQAPRTIERSEGGLGIGLTLVHRLVKMHNGTVRAHSTGKSKGSKFTITLPSAVIDPMPVRLRDIVNDNESDGKKILIVEDNHDAAEMLRIMLTMMNHDVHIVHNGLDALDAAKKCMPDVVLMDIGLPGMSGYEVARKLREDERFANRIFIAMTGYGQERDRQLSLEAGFDEHLVKPVSPDQLILAINSSKRRHLGIRNR